MTGFTIDKTGYFWIINNESAWNFVVFASEKVIPPPTKSNSELNPGRKKKYAIPNPNASAMAHTITFSVRNWVMMSTLVEPEIAQYPDSGNIGVFAGMAPGADSRTSLAKFIDGSAKVDYFEGK